MLTLTRPGICTPTCNIAPSTTPQVATYTTTSAGELDRENNVIKNPGIRPRIRPTLYSTAPNAVRVKSCLVLSTAPTITPEPSTTAWISIIRVRGTIRLNSSGRLYSGTIAGARTNAMIENTIIPTTEIFNELLAI